MPSLLRKHDKATGCRERIHFDEEWRAPHNTCTSVTSREPASLDAWHPFVSMKLEAFDARLDAVENHLATLSVRMQPKPCHDAESPSSGLALELDRQVLKIKAALMAQLRCELQLSNKSCDRSSLTSKEHPESFDPEPPKASRSSCYSVPEHGMKYSSSTLAAGKMQKTQTHYSVDSDAIYELASAKHGVPALNREAHERCAQDGVYEFADTIWDVPPFCCMGILSITDQICISLALLLNLTMQGCFAGLAVATLLHNDFSDDALLKELQDWRVLYAHNPDFADTDTNTPLARDVCDRSALLMEGVQQAQLYGNLADYTAPFLGMPAGGVLCVLSVLLWVLTCAKESSRIALFFTGIRTPNADDFTGATFARSYVEIKDKPAHWMYGEATQHNYQLFITPRRATALTIFVCLPRTLILIVLCAVGCLFLIQTLELTELILNAVALEVVLNVDELLFCFFAPHSAVRMVRKTMPLRVPRHGVCKQTLPWVNMTLASAVLLIAGYCFLKPMIGRMTDAKKTMCGGDLDFLGVQMPYGPVVVGNIRSLAVRRDEYKYRAMFARTRLQNAFVNTTPYMEGSIFSFKVVATIKEWRDRSIEDLARLSLYDLQSSSDSTCSPNSDLRYLKVLPGAREALLQGISSKLNVTVYTCADVEASCFNDSSTTGQIVRLMCPHTCGVRRAFSGLLFDTAKDGSSTACRGFMQLVLKGGGRCQDRSLTALLRTPSWKRYAEGLTANFDETFRRLSVQPGTVGVMNWSHYDNWKKFFWTGMSGEGCRFFGRTLNFYRLDGIKDSWANLCDVHAQLLEGRRSARVFCPGTCLCSTEVSKHFRDLWRSSPDFVLEQTQCPQRCFS